MRFDHLDDWLSWQESLNPTEIELGLDRIARVLSQAHLSSTFECPLITVAGTNGKGSVVAILESIAMSVGLKVCSYTSPHIFDYNERIKCNNQTIDDDALCAAFERIDQARGEEQLTYFEFGTLAAIDWITSQNPDLVIMEVGLGGRLDAVNILDSDVSVLTTVAIDHVDWLGDDREKIGFEKAGIFRENQTVVCGEYDTPKSVVARAQQLHCDFIQIGEDYCVIDNETFDEKNNEQHQESWALKSVFSDIQSLPVPSLLGEFQKTNAATAIVAIQSLQKQRLLPLEVTEGKLNACLLQSLQNITLSGRFQKIYSSPSVYVDVAHNPHAALSLASQLNTTQVKTSASRKKSYKNAVIEGEQKTWAIVAMLSDKDIAGVLANVCGEIDYWCFAGLDDVTRGLPVFDFLPVLSDVVLNEAGFNQSELPSEQLRLDESYRDKLQHDLSQNQCTILTDTITLAKTVNNACEWVFAEAAMSDRIIIFGSFYTVAEAMKFFSELNTERLS